MEIQLYFKKGFFVFGLFAYYKFLKSIKKNTLNEF